MFSLPQMKHMPCAQKRPLQYPTCEDPPGQTAPGGHECKFNLAYDLEGCPLPDRGEIFSILPGTLLPTSALPIPAITMHHHELLLWHTGPAILYDSVMGIATNHSHPRTPLADGVSAEASLEQQLEQHGCNRRCCRHATNSALAALPLQACTSRRRCQRRTVPIGRSGGKPAQSRRAAPTAPAARRLRSRAYGARSGSFTMCHQGSDGSRRHW